MSAANSINDVECQPLRRRWTINRGNLPLTKDHACFRANHFENPVIRQEGPSDINIDVGLVAVVNYADAPLADLGTSVQRILQQVTLHPDGVRFHEYLFSFTHDFIWSVSRAATRD